MRTYRRWLRKRRSAIGSSSSTKTGRAKIINNAEVFKLICYGDAIVGYKYRKPEAELKEFGPVVLAPGGYGVNVRSDSLLAKCCPDL